MKKRHAGFNRSLMTGVATLGIVWSLGTTASSLAASASEPVVRDGHVCTVVGTTGPGSLVGHAGDTVCGLGGDDTLTAVGGGTVILIGGAGHDTLAASSDPTSTDVLNGGRGPDILTAGAGSDTLEGGRGPDILMGGSGSDTLDGGRGPDILTAGTGTDILRGGPGPDSLTGGSGYDTLEGDGGGDSSTAGTRSDVIDGGPGPDVNDCGASSSSVAIRTEGSDDGQNADCIAPNISEGTQAFKGTVTAFDPAAPGLLTMSVDSASSGALAWLAVQSPSCDLAAMSIDLTSAPAAIEIDGGGALAIGDSVEVVANAGTQNCVPVAVGVQAEPADG